MDPGSSCQDEEESKHDREEEPSFYRSRLRFICAVEPPQVDDPLNLVCIENAIELPATELVEVISLTT